MSHIRGKNTKPELMVRKFLYAHGYRYRLHERRLPGTPDIVLRRLHTVILVNGCFWHGHVLTDGTHCRYFVMPKSRPEFWTAKISNNQRRDAADREALRHLGWNVIQIWECELKPAVREQTLQSLVYTLSQIELKHIPAAPVIRYTMEEEDGTQTMVADESEGLWVKDNK